MSATFYYIIVKKDLKFHTFYHEFPKNHIKGLYYIHCSFLRYSQTRKHIFYKYEIFDTNKQPVANNKMIFDDIICFIEDEDYWGNPFGSHNYLTLQVKIYDKGGQEKVLALENKDHDTKPFKVIFNYISNLKAKGTHRELEILSNQPAI